MTLRSFGFLTWLLVAAVAVGCGRTETPAPPAPTVPPAAAPLPPAAPGTTAPAPPPATSTVGQKVDDATITAKVKTALLADPDVKGTDINVDTSAGVVSLKGVTANQAQADKAVQIARGVEGVSNVQSQLTVK
jgi:hyperosmotically inducible protein